MKKGIWIGLIVLALLAAAGGGGTGLYALFYQVHDNQAQTLQTATVSQGDILITADGTGNLMPSDEKSVSF